MIKSITLKNFRNFSLLNFDIPEGISVITGENGTGKTSILEAIYYASRFESFRTSEDRDLIKEGEQVFFIQCDYTGGKIEVGYDGKKRKIRKNGVYIKSASSIYGALPVVSFLPEDILLVSGPPEIKRRFLDSSIGLVSAEYREKLREYTRVLKHRNKLIKEIKEGKTSFDALYPWSFLLAQHGSYIIEKRREFIKELLPLIQRVFNAFADKNLSIEYMNRSGTGEEFVMKLAENQDKELLAGYTLYGPHRDSFSISMDGLDAGTHASYGYQRIIAFSLRMAETEMVKMLKKQEPVVLVDEVVNELDEKNRQRFMEVLSEFPQTLLATVSPVFANFKNMNIFILETKGETTEIRRIA